MNIPQTKARHVGRSLLQPRVESLEDRTVPAAYHWFPIGNGTFQWNNAGNWRDTLDQPGVPGPGDTATADVAGTVTIVVDGNVTVAAIDINEQVRIVNGGSLNVTSGLSKIGQVDLQTGGTLHAASTSILGLGGVSNYAGTFVADTNATLAFSSVFATHTFAPGVSFTGPGHYIANDNPNLNFITNVTLPDSFEIEVALANIASGFTVTTGARFTMDGGTLSGPGTLKVPAGKTFDWSGGDFANLVVNVDPAANLIISNTVSRSMTASTINNSGVVNWTGDCLIQGTDSAISNPAGSVIDISGNGIVKIPITNAGTINKSSAIANSHSEVHVLNTTGVVNVDSGVLQLRFGNSTGAFNTQAGSTLWFSGTSFGEQYFLEPGSAVNGQGLFRVSDSGNAVIDTNITVPNFDQGFTTGGGTISGTGNFTITNAWDWMSGGGGHTGTGTTILAPTATLTITGSNQKGNVARVIELNGTTNWSGSGLLQIIGGTVKNNAGAVFNDLADHVISSPGGGNFVNAGTYNRSAPGNTDAFTTFDNDGIVNLNSGGFLFRAGTSTGEFHVASSATLTALSPSAVLETSASITGAGKIAIDGGLTIKGNVTAANVDYISGTLTGPGNLNVTNVMNWTGGTTADSAGMLTIANGATLNITGNGTKELSQRTLHNSGTINWSGAGAFVLSFGAALNNDGDFQILSGSSLGGAQSVLTNAGNITKSGVASTTSISGALAVSNNGGTVTVNTGTLAFGGVYTQVAGTTTIDAAAELEATNVTIQNGALQGNGLVDADVNNSGTVRPGTSPGFLTIDGNYTQGATGALAIEIGGTVVTTQYDRLAITGQASLNGTLALSTINGFAPAVGNTFDVVTYASKTGDFMNVTGLNVGGNVQYTKSTGATAVTIGVAPSLPNSAPVNTVPAGPLSTPANISFTINGISIADADAGSAMINVTFGVAHGTLTVNSAVSGGVTAGQISSNNSASVSITATLAQINATLGNASGLTYTPANGFNGTDILTVFTNDLGNTGAGGAKTDADSVSINVGTTGGGGTAPNPVNGTAGADVIVVKRNGSSTTSVLVTLNGVDLGPYSSVAGQPLVINGLAGNDNIAVNSDVLVPLVLNGGDGEDTIVGGQGNDSIDAGLGNDLAFGGLGDDMLFGNDGADSMDGQIGNDSMDGGAGGDLIFGSAGNDILFGQFGADALDGGDGNDGIDGGADGDYLAGGIGNDYIVGDSGNDSIDAGDGNDSIDGGDDNDVIFGTGGDDVAYGGNGNDAMDLGAGNDTADGGAGNDLMFGSAGNDVIAGGLGNDSMDGNDGDDTIDGGANEDLMFGSAGNDLLFGGAGNDAMDGGPGTDTADGGAGVNSIFNVP